MSNTKINQLKDLNIVLFLVGFVLMCVFFSLGKRHGEEYVKEHNSPKIEATNEKDYKETLQLD